MDTPQYDSLIPDPFYSKLAQTIPGNFEEKREALLRYMDYSIIEGELYGKIYFPTNQYYGVSVWSKPLKHKDEVEKKKRKREFLVKYLGQDSFIFYNQVVEFMNAKSTELVPLNSWYLSIVGLKPSCQNRQLGETLIRPILENTDINRATTYLETFNPRNISFYQRLGYKVIGTFNESIINSEYSILIRWPNEIV